MAGGEFLMEAAVEQARKRSHRVSFACATIAKAALGNDAGPHRRGGLGARSGVAPGLLTPVFLRAH